MHQSIALKGELPSDADGEVNRTACIVGFAGPVQKQLPFKLKAVEILGFTIWYRHLRHPLDTA